MVGTLVRGVGVQYHVILFALNVSLSLYRVISSIFHGVANYFMGFGVWVS